MSFRLPLELNRLLEERAARLDKSPGVLARDLVDAALRVPSAAPHASATRTAIEQELAAFHRSFRGDLRVLLADVLFHMNRKRPKQQFEVHALRSLPDLPC